MPINPGAMKDWAKHDDNSDDGDGGGEDKFKPRPPGEANAPVDKSEEGDGKELDFEKLEEMWPQFGALLEKVAEAHAEDDDDEMESAVEALCNYMAGHGMKAPEGDEDEDEGDGGEDNAEDEEDEEETEDQD